MKTCKLWLIFYNKNLYASSAGDYKMATKKITSKYVALCLDFVETLGLVTILISTVLAAFSEVYEMYGAGVITLGDLLLLFLYLEVFAMIGWYYQKGTLPVRFPLYIAIIALARYIILDIKEMDEIRLIGVTAGILFLAIAVLVIRYGHLKYPYESTDKKE